MNWQRGCWFPCLVLAASGAASAAGPDAKDLGGVVVTATRTEVAEKDVPGSVTVITAEDIRDKDAQDLLEALRGSTGITLSGRGVGGRKVIRIRGTESRHTLILVNGRRISASDENIGHSDFQYNWVPMEAIERIEVVRGPLSSLYGSEALGGVVNIITKSVPERWTSATDLSGGVLDDGEGGDTYRVGGYTSGPLVDNRVGLSFSAEVLREADTPDEDDPRLSEREGKKVKGGSATLAYRLDTRQTLELSMLGSEEERWRDAEGSSGVHEGVYDIDRLHMALAYRGDFGSSKLTVQAYRSWEDADYETTAGETSANRLIDEVVDAHGSFALGSSQLLTLGGEYRNEKLENALFAGGEEKATHKALFAQDEVEIGQSITVTAGVRWDEHDFFDAEVSPRLYAVYHATDTLNLKGGYGHGFKAPTLKQLSPEYVFRGPHTFYGNPDLQPEVSDSYELGAEYDGEGVSAKLIFFRNEIDDLIDTECIANCDARFGREFRYVNVDEAQTQGVEAELEAGLGRDLTLGLNYGYLDAEDMKSEERLEGRPRHSANARLTHRYAPWGLRTTIGYEYVGSQILNDEKAPGYSLWHLGFGKDLAKGLELRFGVDNLTDERLADEFPHFEYEERGRFFYAGLRAAF